MENKEIIKAKESTLNSIKRQEIKIFNDHANKLKITSSLKLDYLTLGRFMMLLNESEYRSKLSIAGMLYDFALTKVSNGYWIGIDDISLIILSDHINLFKEINKRKNYVLGQEEGGWCGMQYAMLQIASSDWDGLKTTIEYLKGVKPPYDKLFHDIDIYYNIYNGFLERNKLQIQDALNTLEQEKFRKVRQKLLTIEKDISIITLALGRLAWMHGMEVEVNSEYIPKELLPFDPLDEYIIPYKILRDFYREELVDWRYDPIQPELQNWSDDKENTNPNKGGLLKRFFN